MGQLRASSTATQALSARDHLAGRAGALAGNRRHQQDAAFGLSGARWAPLANCAITNVPGSREPCRLPGAKLTYLSAIMPVHDGDGLVSRSPGG